MQRRAWPFVVLYVFPPSVILEEKTKSEAVYRADKLCTPKGDKQAQFKQENHVPDRDFE